MLMVSGNGIQAPRTVSDLKPRKMTDKGIQYELPPQTAETFELKDTPQSNHCTVAEINTTDCESTMLTVVSNHRPRSTESLPSEPEKRRTVCENVDEICVQPVSSSEVKVDEEEVDSTNVKKEEDDVKEKPDETSCGIECLYFTMQCCECTIL